MGGYIVLGIVCVVFFIIVVTIALFQVANRLGGIEEGLEKISILLAVMANKQGATQEDIMAATQGDVQAQTKDSADTKSNRKSKK